MTLREPGVRSDLPGEQQATGTDTVADVPVTGSDGAGSAVAPAPTWKVWLRRVLAVLWLAAVVAFLYRDGVPVDRETIIGFTVAGLLVWSLGRRPLRSVLVDWLPFVVVLIVYDYTRGLGERLGSPTQWTWQIDTDRVLGFGVVPTTWLQEHLKQAAPPLWEVTISLVYISFFFVPYLVAGWLWLRSRASFRQFAVRFVTLSFLGAVIFVAMPAAPPWAAAQCTAAQVADHPADPSCMDEFAKTGAPGNGLLGDYVSRTDADSTSVDRISSRGFASLHLKNAVQLLDKALALKQEWVGSAEHPSACCDWGRMTCHVARCPLITCLCQTCCKASGLQVQIW